MRWDDLELILALARRGTTAEAGVALGVNQSTISRRLGALNASVGVALFHRDGRRLVPTAAGREAVATAERMEAEALRLQRRLSRENVRLEGSLRLSATETALVHLLPDAIASFARRYPKIELRIDSTATLADLERRQADVVVRITDSPKPSLVGRRFGRFAYALYARHDVGESATAIGYPPPRGDLATRAWFQERFPDHVVTCRVASDALQYHLVRAGLGVAQLPCFIGDVDPTLVRVPNTPLEYGSELWVLTHQDLRRTARVSVLREHLHEALGRRRDLIEGRQPLRSGDSRSTAESNAAESNAVEPTTR